MTISPPAGPTMGLTVYGCEPDEAALFRTLAPSYGVRPTITDAAVSVDNAELARGNRCVSIGHKTHVTAATLLALRRAGVTYVSTRSIGYNHIDVRFAESIGVTVGNVAYSPDSVADYTLMLMLMAIRHAKSTLTRAEAHDYRLHEVRGRELRDLTVGVIGTGRIGAAVMRRLRGFGGRILAYDSRPNTPAEYVALHELLRRSDIVTLHTPLTAQTHHLLDRRRIELLQRGAVVVNTGRGPLLDTEALVDALESEHLGGAALDVIEGEEGIFYADCGGRPIENDLLLRLQKLPSVLISPHTAYFTDHALSDTVENSILHCRNHETGRTQGIGDQHG
ncbi:D-isomer specific 2-hydroxyacid dehydrogenase family protein [Dactylosporangium matsuzakiense]|uniref:Lactate dehydrogenase n=1 Tax=Dactylosporangium matsuzakiense TaxID=53360 RepID=A0A9W6KHM5_9ACTN|nr:D-isomer specific 2-hydroxyacid dehydrogenase family protein [Dactylosporangium matsuzakiense]UWZ48782.1 lactate dehydrogenase [Dactylosporangium matsuzakiense]GLL01117.1 lactate dehydrogenase [Dactylosporangium matsuzakiense]